MSARPASVIEIPDASRVALMRWHRPHAPVHVGDSDVAWALVDDEIREVSAPVLAVELRKQAEALTATVRQSFVGRESALTPEERAVYARLFQVLSERADELDPPA
jgi:hypothetical protein